MDSWILTITIFSPLVGVILLALTARGARSENVRNLAFGWSLLTFLLSLWAMASFYQASPSAARYVLTQDASWLGDGHAGIDISYRVGVDGIGIWLLVLTSFLSSLAIWSSFSSIKTRVVEYYALLLLLEIGMLGVFCARDLLLFYVFFEFTLIPLYFLIGLWGGPQRKYAANKFFIYTLAGSVLLFAGILYLGYTAYRDPNVGAFTLNLETLTWMGQNGAIPAGVQWWLFLAFAAGFAIKVPLFPVHTWLPLAHTEAPTAGSVILAGVLLKLGTYGFCRVSIPVLPAAAFQLAPIVAVLAIVGIIYAALAAWVQEDVKKLVAYSSVSHLGFCMLGLFSLKLAGLTGGVLYMINHGLSTGALFLVIGCIYERYHTRNIHSIGGLARPMPIMAFFLVYFTLCSIALPGLNGFVSEFLVLLGTATSAQTFTYVGSGVTEPAGPLGYTYAIFAAVGIILGAVYMLWMCRCVLFGPVKEPPNTPDSSAGLTKDLTAREIAILTPIAVACLVLGVFPKPVTDTLEPAIVQNVLRLEEPADALARMGSQSIEASQLPLADTFMLADDSPPQKPLSASAATFTTATPTKEGRHGS